MPRWPNQKLVETYPRLSVEATERKRASSRKRVAQWRIDNPEKYRQQYLAYQHRNRDKILAANKDRRKRNPEPYKKHSRRANLKKNFGITLEQRDALLDRQGGVCAICGSHESERALHVDHCHSTGSVRGILCHRCNTGIGMFRDNIEFLSSAIQYLGGVTSPTI
jgi:hypothetical protein